MLPALAAKHRVTLINLPGFHGSQPPLLALMDAYVAAIEDGFQEFDIGNDAILIGNGFGGTVALAFAIAHPERIAKLVLSDAAAGFPPRGPQGLRGDGAESRRGRARRDRRDRRQAGVFAGLSRRASGDDRGAQAGAARHRSEGVPGRLQDLAGGRSRCRCCIALQVPTLVVCGEFDQATPPALNKAIAEKVAGARYVELPGCGHCPPLSSRRRFIAAIKDFVGL